MAVLIVWKADTAYEGQIENGWAATDNTAEDIEATSNILAGGRWRMRGINLSLFDVVKFVGGIPDDIDRDKKYILNDADPENATIEDNPAWEGDE